MKRYSLLLIGVIFLITSPIYAAEGPGFQKGISYVTWTRDSYGSERSDQSLAKIKAVGAEWVSFLVNWYQKSFDSTKIKQTAKTASTASLVHAIRKAKELGLKVMLKPHLDLIDQTDGKWRGSIEMASDEDWQKWFKSYSDFILRYAKLANDENVEMFCIGTELTGPATSQPEFWKGLIKEVRKVYPGYVTYAANWYEEYSLIEFWDQLDIIGIDPYFPIIEKDQPTLEEMKEAWAMWVDVLDEWQATVNRPVFFAEIGYKSSTGSLSQPWAEMPGKKVDLKIQLDAYQAVLETFWDKPWFYGLYWWDWGTSPKMGGKFNRGFTPQNKPAEGLIKQWFAKPNPR